MSEPRPSDARTVPGWTLAAPWQLDLVESRDPQGGERRRVHEPLRRGQREPDLGHLDVEVDLSLVDPPKEQDARDQECARQGGHDGPPGFTPWCGGGANLGEPGQALQTFHPLSGHRPAG